MDIKRSILIVDDEAINLSMLSKVLKGAYRVLIAKSGKQALQVVEKNEVDLILLDIVMPEMDGYEVLRRLKSSDAYKNIPVIFITSKSEAQDEAVGLQLGAVDYIGKPFYPPIVEARIQTHLELKMKNEILTELVSLDGLTNVFNRRKFDETLSDEWIRAARTRASLSLLMMDVDHFKLFNDNYGHAAGDVCLRKIAGALKSCLKRPADFLARYGGEEFAVLLPGSHRKGSEFMANEIKQRISGLELEHAYSPTAPFVTLSIGGAVCEPCYSCKEPVELIEKADEMLYSAKNEGRNRFIMYDFS